MHFTDHFAIGIFFSAASAAAFSTEGKTMYTAKETRIGRLFHPEYQRSIIIPIDHGFYLGNAPGLEDPYETMRILLEEGVDATILSYGLAKITNEAFTSKSSPTRILAIDNAILSNVPGEPANFLDFELGVPVEQALKAGFDVIKVLLIWGLDPDIQMKEIKAISTLVSQCDSWQIPLMIEPLLLGDHIPPDKRNDPDLIAHASRIAVELGADILKIPYTGDSEHFQSIVQRSHVPVLILGGAQMGSPKQMFRTARESVEAGGKGIVFGRSVWQHNRIRELIRGLKDAVYFLEREETIVGKYSLV
jgi:class I fructose-bisphosphate aldolase